MGSKWTFQIKPIAVLLERYMQKGKYLVPFGGLTRFPTKEGREVVYIDLNPKLPKPYILGDAFEIMQEMIKNGERWDGLILDPPYTYYQTVRTYGMKRVQEITQLRTLTERLVNEDGWVITLGYNSTGMGESRGWTKQEIMIVNLGGSHNDIIITVEMRDQSKKRKRYFEELDALVKERDMEKNRKINSYWDRHIKGKG
jgi:hypothetical protein